ncbi:hypothetical protein D3C87_2107220 [compost metagenome]
MLLELRSASPCEPASQLAGLAPPPAATRRGCWLIEASETAMGSSGARGAMFLSVKKPSIR